MRIEKIWKIGVADDIDPEDRRRVMFSNGVYWIAGFIILLQELITGVNSPIPIFLIGLAALCLLLNAIKLYVISRFLFILTATFLISIWPIVSNGPTPSSYFTHPFYIILSAPVIHLLFSRQKEKFNLFFFLGVSFLLTLFSIDFLLAFDRSSDPHVPLVSSTSLMRVTFAVLWLFLNMLMAYVLKINSDFYTSLKEQKDLVGQQRLLLEKRNAELSRANGELTFLNEEIRQLNVCLEKRVDERTDELHESNKTLSDYAFMNSHLLRSPVSRIKGLIHLFSLTNDPEEKMKVQEILLRCTDELDEVVHSIGEKLYESKKDLKGD